MSGGTAITIGSFDGAHVGHRALVRAAAERVGPDGTVLVLSFDPHPGTVLRPSDRPWRLSSFEQRRQWLEAAGADRVEPLVPTPGLLETEPEAFVADIVARHRPRVIVEGPDFRFGRGRAGDVQTLADLADRYGYALCVIDPVEVALTDGTVVAVRSSLIRWLLERGRVRDAAAALGRPYEIRGPVVRGDRRGRDIGMPTANLDHGPHLLPADGIYAGIARRPDGTTWPAAISVGTKPTFGEHPRTCETHLVGWEGGLEDYGWTMQLRFTDWVREQLPFADVDALVAQMHRDVERITRLLSPVAGLQGAAAADGRPDATSGD